MVRNTTPANTASFPHSIGSRRGTTVSEERIIPVLYSPVISSTPRTPMASCAKNVPVSEVETADCAGLQTAGLVGGDGREQGAETDHQHDGDQQGVDGRPQRAELRPFGQHDPGLGDPQAGAGGAGCRWGWGARVAVMASPPRCR